MTAASEQAYRESIKGTITPSQLQRARFMVEHKGAPIARVAKGMDFPSERLEAALDGDETFIVERPRRKNINGTGRSLTDGQAAAACFVYFKGYPIGKIARHYGVSWYVIHGLVSGKTYPHITIPA